jgi:putative DNA primase/helicase
MILLKGYNLPPDGTTPSFTDLAESRLNGALESATLYTRMGLRVVPCEDKKPIHKNWPKLRLNLEDLPRYFDDGQNVALLLGQPSEGLANVDLDVEEVRKIVDRFLPETLVSGREGTPASHRWYVSPELKSEKWLDTDGAVLLEIRSTGSLTLVEPSVHPGGESYAWGRAGLLEPVEIASEDLQERCVQLATATIIGRHLPPIGGRHEYAKAVIGCLLRRLDRQTIFDIVFAAWHAADADSEEAVRDLEGIVEDTGRRLAAGENAFGGPTLEEMVSGLPKLLNKWWGWKDRERSKKGNSGNDEEPSTHDELRDRWFEGRKAPTAHGLGEWREYADGHWASLHQQVVAGEIEGVLIEAKPEGVMPTAGMRSSVERLARPLAFVPDERWDANEDILVCGNGTLEISSGILREHRPEDYALGTVPYEFDPEAVAPTWRRFLASTVPEAASFLQGFAGYSLTGETLAELAVWLYGPPGSGKSTFIEGLKAMLGARAGLLGLAEIQRSRFALSKLPGKTLVTATEQPSDFISVTHLLNAIISGEEVRVEEKFKPAYTVIPWARTWESNPIPTCGAMPGFGVQCHSGRSCSRFGIVLNRHNEHDIRDLYVLTVAVLVQCLHHSGGYFPNFGLLYRHLR